MTLQLPPGLTRICHRQYITLMERQLCRKTSASVEGLNGNEEVEGGGKAGRQREFPLLCVCAPPQCQQIIKSIFRGGNSISRSDLPSPL